MSEENEENKKRTPGPFWLWCVIAVLFAVFVRRVVIGKEKVAQFNVESQFMDNLLNNIIWGGPIILLYGVIFYYMNREKT